MTGNKDVMIVSLFAWENEQQHKDGKVKRNLSAHAMKWVRRERKNGNWFRSRPCYACFFWGREKIHRLFGCSNGLRSFTNIPGERQRGKSESERMRKAVDGDVVFPQPVSLQDDETIPNARAISCVFFCITKYLWTEAKKCLKKWSESHHPSTRLLLVVIFFMVSLKQTRKNDKGKMSCLRGDPKKRRNSLEIAIHKFLFLPSPFLSLVNRA